MPPLSHDVSIPFFPLIDKMKALSLYPRHYNASGGKRSMTVQPTSVPDAILVDVCGVGRSTKAVRPAAATGGSAPCKTSAGTPALRPIIETARA
jgi:hypothetical protein